MGTLEKTLEWGRKKGLNDIKNRIEKVVKKKRLVFLDDNLVSYTDKNGNKSEYTFDEMVNTSVKVGGWTYNMATLGINDSDIKNILVEEYNKQNKKGAK